MKTSTSMRASSASLEYLFLAAAVVVICWAPAVHGQDQAPSDSSLVLPGGQDGTVFKSLTVEGENRVQIQFERPELNIDLDPQAAPGLAWGDALDVLDRTVPDLVAPYLAASANWRSPYAPRPWLDRFASGSLARFQPAVKGVERWSLLVVDSRGEVVREYTGENKPPKEIAWDGRNQAGEPVPPGLTYSYVFEAYDKAGNKRRFIGDGFQLPPYRIETENGPAMLISGEQWVAAEQKDAGGTAPHAYLIEVVSWLNLHTGPLDPLQVVATARAFDEAHDLGQRVQAAMQPFLNGDPARLAVVARVEAGAPDGGTLLIGPVTPEGKDR